MSKGMEILIRFELDPKNRAAFDTVANGLVSAIRENEPNTLEYAFFVSADDTTVVLHERYPDSAAFLAHMARTKDDLGALLAIAKPLSVYILGDASPEARAILDGFGAKYLAPAAAFSR